MYLCFVITFNSFENIWLNTAADELEYAFRNLLTRQYTIDYLILYIHTVYGIFKNLRSLATYSSTMMYFIWFYVLLIV